MRQALAVAVLVVVGCSKPLAFELYREPAGTFTAEVPVGWPKDFDDAFTRKPIAGVSWVGKLVDGGEGRAIGAVIEVRKLWRLKKDHPAPKDYERFNKSVLEPTADLFNGAYPADVLVSDGVLSGLPAKIYSRNEFDQATGGGMHGAVKHHPSRVEGVVLQTPEAYYVLEYRATKDLFDKHRPAFERLKTSFKLGADNK